jgi:hypothetical protein
MPGRLRRWIFRWMTRRIESSRRRDLARGPREQMHGLTVVAYRCSAERARAILDWVRAALDLIARHDPGSLSAMRDHFAHVQVVDILGPLNAQYWHEERLCRLSGEYVQRDDTVPGRLAMTLVHELTHARHRNRARPGRLSVAQEEWLCIGAELAFIKKVPGSERLQRAARQRLERRPEFYARPAQAERVLEYVRSSGMPRWCRWIFQRLWGPMLARIAEGDHPRPAALTEGADRGS